MGFLGEIHDDLRRYLERPGGSRTGPLSPLRGVAYFSPEFGIAEALPQYSGGLGVLAGDHLKAASSLGVPLIGVGLMYRQGYFRQQLERRRLAGGALPGPRPPRHGPRRWSTGSGHHGRPGRRSLSRPRSGVAQVGRVELYLLDADVDDNDDELRAVTDRLYGGGTEHRIRQEILLGIGGVRALEAVGRRDPGVPHQRGPRRLPRSRADPEADHQRRPGVRTRRSRRSGPAPSSPPTRRCRPASTASPAELMERYFRGWAEECGISHRRRSWRSATSRARPRDGAVQHGGDGPAPGRPCPTACPSCTARPAARCSSRCGRPCRPRRCRSARSPTACTAGRGCRRRWTISSPSTSRPAWDEAGPDDWARIARRPRRRAVAGPGAGPGGPGQLRAGPAAHVAPGPGRVRERRGLDRRGARPALL